MNRPTWHETFISMLDILADRSLCLKVQTAAMLVRDNQILSMGYNGTLSKSDECCDYWKRQYIEQKINIPWEDWIETEEFRIAHREWSRANEIHAEINALRYISKPQARDCTLYTIYSPCETCAKTIIAYGIKQVYYKHLYKHGDTPRQLLIEKGIKCEKYNDMK